MSKIIVSKGNEKLNVSKEFLVELNIFNDLIQVDKFIDKEKNEIEVFSEKFGKIPSMSVKEHFIWSNNPADMDSFWVLANNKGELLTISNTLHQHVNKFFDILLFLEMVSNVIKENKDTIFLFEGVELKKEDMIGTEYLLYSATVKEKDVKDVEEVVDTTVDAPTPTTTENENNNEVEEKTTIEENTEAEIVETPNPALTHPQPQQEQEQEQEENQSQQEQKVEEKNEDDKQISDKEEDEEVYNKQIVVKKKPTIIMPEFNTAKEEE